MRKTRARRARARLAVVTGLFLALMLGASPVAYALPPKDDARTGVDLVELPEAEALAEDSTATTSLESLETATSTEVDDFQALYTEPIEGGSAAASLTGLEAGELVKVTATDGTVPVEIGAPTDATSAEATALEGNWSVEMASDAQADAAGVKGVVLEVAPPATATGEAVIALDAADFSQNYGAEWMDRLDFWMYPSCFLTTPDVEGCSEPTAVPTEVVYDEVATTITDTTVDEDSGASTTTEKAGTDLAPTVHVTVDVEALVADPTATTSTATTADATGTGSVSNAVYTTPSDDGADSGIRTIASGSSGSGVLMGNSDGAGAGGDFAATPLPASGSWSAGSSSGAFSYSYPLAGPAVPNGPTPNVAFSYNSQSVDGKTSSTNNQASGIGEGWSWDPGSITRTYTSCMLDATTGANNKGKTSADLCYGTKNATLTLNGTTTELVYQSGAWRTANGDNTKIELLTNTALANGDDDGEYWRITDTAGTQYYYGLNHLPGWASGKGTTDSVFTVPVASNHDGEPGYDATFKNSFQDQAWKWNLDYVVDVNGNAMSLWWESETNHYAKAFDFDNPVAYERGGFLKRIDYGQRSDTLYTAEPLARMTFTADERCLESEAKCASGHFTSGNWSENHIWYDTPADLYCGDSGDCTTPSPTFWSRKLITQVTSCTQRVRGASLTPYDSKAGTGDRHACALPGQTSTPLAKVDRWSLKQSFPWDKTGHYTALWLESVTRTGYGVDGSTESVNPVSFHSKLLPNRIPTSSTDEGPTFARLRIDTVVSEYGGETQVTYSTPKGACASGTGFPDPDENHLLCYPVYWHADPELADQKISWFQKYVVDTVVEMPNMTGLDNKTTSYDYTTFGDAVDGALWAYNRAEGTRKKTRTWDQWRGYPRVTVTVGSDRTGSKATRTATRYFRGMSDDLYVSGSGTSAVWKTRDTTMTDTAGATIKADKEPYAGMVAEAIVYADGSSAADWVSRTVNIPDDPTVLATRVRGVADTDTSRVITDDPDLYAWRVTLDTTRTVTRSSGKGDDSSPLRTVSTQTDYDSAYGLPTKVVSHGDLAVTGDESCTYTSYVNDATLNLIGLVSSTISVSGTSCATGLSSSTASTLLSASKMAYDGASAASTGQTLTKGQVTKVWDPVAAGTSWNTVPASTTGYDGYGRVVSSKDYQDNQDTITFVPDKGQVYSVTSTNAKTQSSTSTLEPGRGVGLTEKDANGNISYVAYDPLGRVCAGWEAGTIPNTTYGPVCEEDLPVGDDGETPRTWDEQSTGRPNATFVYNTDPKRPVSVVTSGLKDDGTYTDTTVIYDGLGRVRQEQTGAVGGKGRLITDTLYNGNGQISSTNNAYYTDGVPETSVFAAASTSTIPNATQYTYDGLGRTTTITPVYNSYVQDGTTDADGTKSQNRTTTYLYGLDYTTVVQPTGSASSRTWVDALGRTTRMDTFSSKSAAASNSFTASDFKSTDYTYDARSDQTGVTDSAGNVWKTTYNAIGQPDTSTDPDTGTTTLTYDTLGRVATSKNQAGFTTKTSYDVLDRPLLIEDNSTGTDLLSYTYDDSTVANGVGQLARATRYTDGKAYTTSVGGYTLDGNPTSKTLTLPAVASGLLSTAEGFATTYKTSYAYTESGQLASYTTPAMGGLPEEKVIVRYNADGLPVSTSGTDWYTSQTSYSVYGEVLRTTTGEQGSRVWTTNLFDEATGQAETTLVDRESTSDATSGLTGNRVNARTYAYDLSGNITTTADTYAAVVDRQCFTYDGIGQLTEAWTTQRTGCTVPVATDGTVNVTADNAGYWQSYTYDELGNRKTLNTHNAKVSFTLDGAVNTAADSTTSYVYGIEDATKGSGLAQPHTLTSMTSTYTNSGGSKVTEASALEYDALGQTTSRTIGGDAQGITWTWDGKAQTVTGFGAAGKGAYTSGLNAGLCMDLSSASTTAGTAIQMWPCNGSKAEQFRVKDAVTTDTATKGPLQVAGVCVQPTGKVVTAGTAVVVAACDDTATQQWTVTSTGALKYATTSMCLVSPSNSTTTGVDLVLGACDGTATQAWNPANKTSYVYDAFGNRIISTTANDRTLYLDDTTFSLRSTGAVNYVERSYVQPGAPTVVRRGAGEANLYALVADHHGTPMAEIKLTTGNQTVFSRLDPYGNERTESSNWRSHTGYVGGTDDNTTGLTHLGAREYDPSTGRFLSADPVLDLTDPLQANGYNYANNNPVTHADPTGLTSTASTFDAAEAALDAQIAAQEKILSGSVTDIVRTYGWALFKEFIGWDEVVGCFTQGDLWACGSLLVDAIPWTKVFKLAYKVAKVVGRIISGIKALNKAKDVARKTIASLKAAKAAVKRAKAEAKRKAAEALKKAKEKALAAKAAAKKKTGTGSKGTAGKAEHTKASASAKSNGAKKAKDNHADGGDSTDADDSGSGGSCEASAHSFLPGTQVLMADGTTKNIEDVKTGDELAANDPETSTTSGTEPAAATITTYDDKDFTVLTVKTADGTTSKLTTTDTHPFWVTDPATDPTDGTWVEGGTLKPGQWLQTSAGTHVQITAITRYTRTQVTHDLTVSNVHTYYVLAGAAPVLVHNCGGARFEVDSSGVASDLENPVTATEPYNRAKHYGGSQTNGPGGRTARAEAQGQPCPECGATMRTGTANPPVPEHDPALVLHYYRGGGSAMTNAERRAYAKNDGINGAACQPCQQSQGAEMAKVSKAIKRNLGL
ncbi:ricin-type beta-trefoil lectin domain protein [Streptomyces sp. SID12488]|uniref:ricin-type beta-trefoil lectin domain protein n=1 Tax=Streptomyces sp. SID12488 TaxID=2706040 RepID=UPI0013DD2F98|nr:ricin-type beta-trefoil lectin domain protein [Streptomyces sp. SID12488]NEA65615.1 sugar-binding protein [Streptomyces sp. SID12488]